MATTYNNSAANIQYLSAKTGLAPSVAAAWLANEGQSVANPTNPLNIIKGGTPNQTGTSGGFGTYASPTAGLDAAAWLLTANSAYKSILTAIQSGTPIQQAQAIQNSPWAAGHYGYSGISSMISPTGTATPGGGASTPITSTPTATNPPSMSNASSTAPTGVVTGTLSAMFSQLKPTYPLDQTTIDLLMGTGVPADNPNRASIQAGLVKAIGTPINQVKLPTDWSATPTGGWQNFWGGQAGVNGSGGGLGNSGIGPNIPDVQTAITFLAIILVGIAFIGVGGLIALRKK